MTHAARCEPDEHLTLVRLRQLDLLDDERLTELLEHCGADLHPAQANRNRARGLQIRPRRADRESMIWPVAALAAVFLCFVVVYGTRLQAQIEATRDTRR